VKRHAITASPGSDCAQDVRKRVAPLQRRLDATGANGAPTDPCLKGTEQSDEDKDRCEEPCLRNKTTTGKEENDRKPTAGNAAFTVDIRLHSGGDEDFSSNTN
jgi:hypothetical protein